ncbi:MAG: cobalt-precorrin-6A reductase [Nocardioidaceae bacterium]
MRVLLLGGTQEARSLAASLLDEGVPVVSSLAGRVARPRLPAGEVRSGGFGGVAGLVGALAGFDVLVDATHPFAATISRHAAQASHEAGVPLLRLSRPGWAGLPGARRWHWVDSHAEAAAAARQVDGPVFLTTGRQTLDSFVPALAHRRVLVRVVDPVERPLPSGWSVLLGRGPYTLPGERALMTAHGVRVLVTKDSGGEHTRAKLEAAEALGLDVVVIRRPEPTDDGEQVSDVADALRWLRARR